MSDWLDDELDRINKDNNATANEAARQQEISLQCDTLWRDLRSFIEEDVRRMNASPEIRRKVGDVTFNGTNTQIMLVDKLVFPAVHITINREYISISVERVIIRNGGSVENAKQDRESERLHCDLDHSGNVCYRTEGGDWLRAKEASGYILRPILRVR